MLQVKNVYLSYTKEYYTLNNINLTVNPGQKVVVLGEKDSGKSSLIRVMAGLEKPTKGEVLLSSKTLSAVNFKTDISLGYVSSEGVFLNGKTVRKNLEYVLKIRRHDKFDIKSKVNSAILLNKLNNISELKIKHLGKLDKFRVALVRLSLRKLDLLIIDDIFESLNLDESKILIDIINDLIKQNKNLTVVVATSNVEIAKLLNGNLVKMQYGSIVE